MPQWDTETAGQMRDDGYTTSYGDGTNAEGRADYDGKSCSDYHQIPGRGIEDVESLTILHGLMKDNPPE